MCRSIAEGGRRCPCSRGDRRRAYQRARYAAKKQQQLFDNATNTPGGGQDDDPGADTKDMPVSPLEGIDTALFNPSNLDLSTSQQLTPQQREVLYAHYQRQAEETRQEVNSLLDTLNSGCTFNDLLQVTESFTYRKEFAQYESKVREVGSYVDAMMHLDMPDMLEKHNVSMEIQSDDLYRLFAEDKELYSKETKLTYIPMLPTILANIGSDLDRYHDTIEKAENGTLTMEEWGDYCTSLSPTDGLGMSKGVIKKVILNTSLLSSNAGDIVSVVEKCEGEQSDEAACEMAKMLKAIQPTLHERMMEGYMSVMADRVRNARIEAYQRASGQEFGEQVPVGYKRSTVNKEAEQQFNTACAVFPNAMVRNGVKKNRPLSLSFMPKKRAYFASWRRIDVPVKGKRVGMPHYDGGMSTIPSYIEHVVNADGTVNVEELKTFADSGRFTRDTIDEAFPLNNEEGRARVQEALDYQNGVKDSSGSYRIPSSSGFPKFKSSTFIDHEGNERIIMSSAREMTLYSMRKDMSQLVMDGSLDVTIHELSHYMEYADDISVACKYFLKRRTEGLEPVLYHQTRKKKEMCIPDGFFHRYVGKDYFGSKHTEIFSMGMESLFGKQKVKGSWEHNHRPEGIGEVLDSTKDGDTLSLSLTKQEHYDEEHRNLILGLLSTIRENKK